MKRWPVATIVLTALVVLRNLKRLYGRDTLPQVSSLLLIAHPDDESMFFAPTMLDLGSNLAILCLSEGNYNGAGRLRRSEMCRLCRYLGVKVAVLDFPDNADWDAQSISLVLAIFHRVHAFKRLYTFDRHGVSGHKNHRSCFEGARIFSRRKRIPTLCLRSKGLVAKYCFDLGIRRPCVFVAPHNILAPVRMMLFHWSQLAWYRLGYILLSSYMQYNDYVPCHVG